MPIRSNHTCQNCPDADHFRNLDWIETGNSPCSRSAGIMPRASPCHSTATPARNLWWARQGVVLVRTAARTLDRPAGARLADPGGCRAFDRDDQRCAHALDLFHPIAACAPSGRWSWKSPRLPAAWSMRLSASRAKTMSERREQPDHGSPARKRSPSAMSGRSACLSRATQKLAPLCRQFLEAPSATANIDQWADRLGHQPAVIHAAVPQRDRASASSPGASRPASSHRCRALRTANPVTNVALDAGYENVAAFTTMFRRMLGSAAQSPT